MFLKQNLAAWQALPAEQKTLATQQQALQNFDKVWAQVVNACSNAQYGTAGQNCIGDRPGSSTHFRYFPRAMPDQLNFVG